MWKLTCLLTVAFSAAFVAGSQGRIVSSPFQPAIPFGTAIKMTPDPSSIWSWHHTISSSAPVSVEVPIDVDQNGVPDTANHGVRVLVTDMQAFTPVGMGSASLSLADGAGIRWDLTPVSATGTQPLVSYHFVTPIAITPGSGLRVFMTPLTPSPSVSVNLIGRVVNL
jgi:hypothetical protein